MRRLKWNKKKLAIIISALILIPSILFGVSYITKVLAIQETDAYLKFSNFNPNAQKGTAENPFIILEIVPYRGMGEIGYSIAGQEPVDISASTANNNIYGVINAFAYGAFAPVKQDVLSETDKVAGSWSWSWQSQTKAAQTGYFQKLSDNNGLYNKVVSGGNVKFEKNKEGSGVYNWVSAANPQGIRTDYNSDKVWMTNYTLDISYWSPSSNWKFENLEIFKKQVLNIPEEQLSDFHIRVVTITPDTLNDNVSKFSKYYDLSQNGVNNKIITGANANGEIDLIGNADLINISPKAHAGNSIIEYWEKYGRDKSGISTNDNRKTLNFNSKDLSWQTVMEIFMKVGVVSNKAAFIYDITLFTEPKGSNADGIRGPNVPDSGKGYLNNVYKLCLLLRQRDPVITNGLYFNTEGGTKVPKVSVKTVNNVTTGFYNVTDISDNAKIYWNEYTFLPTFPDGTKPAYITQPSPNYQQYLLDNDILVSWIAGSNAHDVVIRNIYSYNGDSSVVQYFISRYNINDNTYSKYDYNADFFDYLQDKQGTRPSSATPAEAVEYILKASVSSTSIKKTTINILNIEPCNDFTLTEADIRAMLPKYTGSINIVRQTTSEFIGKIEDLNARYDLIYIGQNTGKMKTSGGKTVYNDPQLDGLVYLHVGDRVIAYDTYKGVLRDSNNNIKKAYDFINQTTITDTIGRSYLKNFSKTVYDRIKQNTDFYRFSGNDITNIKKEQLTDYVKAGYPILLEKDLYNYNGSNKIVDDSSYLYQFLSQNASKSNIVNRDDFRQTASLKKAQTYLDKLVGIDKVQINLTKAPVEFKLNDSSTLIENRTLKYQFSITPPAGMSRETFKWNIFVDANADGRFEDKEIVSFGTVKEGLVIDASKVLNEKYMGVIPWKLEVEGVNNPSIRQVRTGYAAFRILDSQKIPIHILQVTSDGSTLDLESLLNPPSGKTSLFYKYTKDLEDFNVIIKTINVSTFLNLYKNGKAYDVNKPEETDKFYYLENNIKYSYDMLIFGFGDCYTNIDNNNGALNNIQAFIDSGKSVMFTHDTTSFVNVENFSSLSTGLSDWGYGFNQYLRNRVGLDRFGIMRNKLPGTYDIATMPSQIRSKNLYSNTSIDGKATYPETQGLTNGLLVAYSNPKADLDIFNWQKDYPPFAKGNAFIQGNNMSNYLTSKVTKVNEGQITSYPYVIPADFQTAETHVQYYQVNMEDPDIVVWYCLSDNNTSGEGAYTITPNDVRNNYYIYSKGNIMYTGVGHKAIDGLVNNGTSNSTYKENEVKLFINTMIASYSAGVTSPRVEIINEDVFTTDNGEFALYNDEVGSTTSTRRVEFMVSDSNLLAGDQIARIYYYNGVNRILLNPQIYSLYGDSVLNYSQSGQESGFYVSTIPDHNKYYFDFPTSVFPVDGTGKIEIVVTNEEGLMGKSKLNLMNLNLFDLD